VSGPEFPICPVCGSDAWNVVYEGAVRDGGFGATRPGRVARCGICGVERLAESLCLSDEAYRGAEYRQHLGQDHDLAKHYATHDELARFTLDVLSPRSLRGKVIADVGCGGGSLLDHLSGLPSQVIAIDPAEGFAPSLRARGYRWFAGATEAAPEFEGKIDIAFSIQVIEHVGNPRVFLAGIRALLKPDGILILSTPNRADILMDLLPQIFPGFFYRTQHRWAFDAPSLARCALAAGFQVAEIRHVHRYGMANALLWLRDRKPSGRATLPPLNRAADDLWRSWLEASGRADNLYMILQPS
jgi:SAM-dependent methyltransferase